MGDDAFERACPACGAPLAEDQRYCLQCGERAAPRSGQLAELLRRTVAPYSPTRAAPAAPSPLPGARAPRGSSGPIARLAALRLPSRRVSAVLVLAFLGFGVLLGNAAGSRVDYGLARSSGPLKVMLPPATTSTASEPETPSGAPEVAEEPTPEVEAEPRPAPSAPAPAPKREAPKSGEGSQGEQNASSQAPAAAKKLPAIEHVFVVMLADEPYAALFGPEAGAHYLARTLEKRGELLARYYGIAHQGLANGIALLSGQGPTPASAADCPTYTAVTPASPGPEGQVLGEGCVYPSTTPTLLGELEVKRMTWRAYVQGLGEAGGPPPCAHPALGQPDPAGAPGSAQPYATFRNPFVYFEGIASSPTCATDDAGLGALAGDLASAKRTPTLSWIVPDRCHDASPGPCPGGGPGGPVAADGWLEEVVPKILASPAYKHGGLLVITADQAPSSGEFADSSSCCGQPVQFPNMPPPASTALAPEGGGQVGALLLSPFVKGGVITQEPYDHFSLLRTIEDLFSLKHLGYAGGAKTQAFAAALFQGKPAG